MTMAANRVVQLCDQSAALIREDLELIESGAIKVVAANDSDITDQQIAHRGGICPGFRKSSTVAAATVADDPPGRARRQG